MKRRITASLLLLTMLLFNSGCAVLGTAIGAGVAYGIYQATKK